jgi:hypothetical protein
VKTVGPRQEKPFAPADTSLPPGLFSAKSTAEPADNLIGGSGPMRRFFISLFMFIFSLLCIRPIPAQPAPDGASFRSAIRLFRDFRLGLTLDEVKSRLAGDPYFNYRGDPDVYFLPVKEQLLIECSGNLFIHRAYFQFVDQRLFTFILDLDGTKVDYFTMLTALSEYYGDYVSFSPQAVVWEKGGVRLALEKPLTVKYIDVAVFNRLKDKGKAQESAQEKSLREFIGEF